MSRQNWTYFSEKKTEIVLALHVRRIEIGYEFAMSASEHYYINTINWLYAFNEMKKRN